MWLATLLAAPFLAYLAILILLFVGQDRLLFPVGQVAPAGPLPPGAELLELALPSGEKLRGVHFPPAGAPPDGRLLVLAFGGNSWNAQAMGQFVSESLPQADVVAFHYRGYPPSEGAPGAAALREDALRIHDFARTRFTPARTVAVGLSLGSGVAGHLAAGRPLDGIILVTPYDSLRAVAAGQYPWLPAGRLLRHDLDPAGALAGGRIPVAIIAAAGDRVIPPARTEALRRAVGTPAFDLVIAAGHNDIYDHPRFRPAMREALARILAAGAPRP